MLWIRVATAAVLLSLFIGGLFFLSSRDWALALLPMMLAGAWEWGTLAGYGRACKISFCAGVVLSALGIFFLTQYGSAPAAVEWATYGISVVFWCGCVPLWLAIPLRVRNPWVLALTGWILLVPTWLALVSLQAIPLLLLAILGIVWVADIAAYFAGHTWGRHKLSPSISPGKTWEGVAGAVVAVAVYYGLVWNFGLREMIPVSGFVAAVLVAVLLPLSIVGDLFESWIKRQAGVKDSGRLLPGHGGVLDRIDALTSTLPLAALAVAWGLHGGQ